MLPHRTLIVCSLVLLASACSHAQPVASPSQAHSGSPESPRPGPARASFDALLVSFAEHDQRRDWTDAECGRIGRGFAEISARHQEHTGRPLATARYNAGLAFQRCGADAEARRQFSRANAIVGGFHAARTELVVYEHRARPNRDRSIERLTQIVSDSKYQDQRALVLLAALELERARELGDGSRERELARANLQRALAIDDKYLPALNQLAVYYLDLARAHANARKPALARPSGEPTPVSRRHLELASLVVERALEFDEAYAPLCNTEGVIQVELGNYTAAGRAFARARQSDPGLVEAHMNYAALNLRFRGFSEAEQAYRAAVALAPESYEAHLGLALALRGQLATADPHRLGLEIERELGLAAKLEPLRPEVDYNHARFALARVRTAQTPGELIRTIEQATNDFRRFVEKAGKDPRFAQDVAKAREQVADLKDTGPFLLEGAQP